MRPIQRAIAAHTQSSQGQHQALALHSDAMNLLLANPHLTPQVAHEILDRKPVAALACTMTEHPVAAEPTVAARLARDPRAAVVGDFVRHQGLTPDTFEALMSRPKWGNGIDHGLVHAMDTMTVEQSDTLAARSSNEFAYAASLRPGTTISDDLLRGKLAGNKASFAASKYLPMVLSQRPLLAPDLLQVPRYQSVVAGSTVLLGDDELQAQLAGITALKAHTQDREWFDTVQYRYLALMSNPVVPQGVIDEILEASPLARQQHAQYSGRAHPASIDENALSELTDEALVDWLVTRTLPAAGYPGAGRVYDLPQLALAPGFCVEVAGIILSRAVSAVETLEGLAMPVAHQQLTTALNIIQQRYPLVAERAKGVIDLIEQSPTSWVPYSCACTRNLGMYEPGCPGCDLEPDISIVRALSENNPQGPHTHVLDDAWAERPHAWTAGLEMIDGYTGPMTEFAHFISDLTHEPGTAPV